MSNLGIYFGPQAIRIVETQGNKLLNDIRVLRSSISISESSEEKVPEEVKIISLLKSELNKHKIEAKEATVCLSGKDLIIRTFEMPVLSTNELLSAVNFEAKKYIPFKIEELISDFQWVLDKSIQKNRLLFAGIKKEVLSKYQSILNQFGFKINLIEYSAFSVLRLLKLAAAVDRGIIAVVNVDFTEDDEVNFMVLENGFPLFSRDITFASPESEGFKTEESPSGITADKLKREIRISLDYYRRKFPAADIKKIYFVSAEDRQDLGAFSKEMGLSAQFIDISRYAGRPLNFSLSFIKAYGASLSKTIKPFLKINLAAPRTAIKPLKEAGIQPKKISLRAVLKSNLWALIFGLLICIIFFLFGFYQAQSLQKELKGIVSMRLKLSALNPNASYAELSDIYSKYREKINSVDNFIKRRLYLTSLLDTLPRVVPKGMWLENFSFKRTEGKAELALEGKAYLGDNSAELELVNSFLSDLKKNMTFNEYFKEIGLVSMDREQDKQDMATHFIISCVSYKEKQ